MTNSTQRFIDYAPRRDVVFVFGAGASAADGVPLQRDILPLVMTSDDPHIRDTLVGSGARDFVESWFGGEVDSGLYPSLEEVFGLLDFQIGQGESLHGDWAASSLPSVRRAIVACIHHVIHANTRGAARTYGRFWELVASLNRNVSVVTLNYDVRLEAAFDRLYAKEALIDYCIPLINYDMPKGVPGFFWWTDPKKPVTLFGPEIPTPIKVLRIHGSLTWKYCSVCRGVLLTPWETAIDLELDSFTWTHGASCDEPESTFELVCPYDAATFEPLILPPSHIKHWAHPALTPLYSESMRELREARHVVFVGYSFPEADVHIRSLLERSIGSAQVTVVDPALSDYSRARYRSVSPNAQFVESTFDAFIDNELGELLMEAAGD